MKWQNIRLLPVKSASGCLAAQPAEIFRVDNDVSGMRGPGEFPAAGAMAILKDFNVFNNFIPDFATQTAAGESFLIDDKAYESLSVYFARSARWKRSSSAFC